MTLSDESPAIVCRMTGGRRCLHAPTPGGDNDLVTRPDLTSGRPASGPHSGPAKRVVTVRGASRPSGWPVRRTPRWMLAGGALLAAGLTLAALPHRPSTAQRAADLRGMVHDLTVDIESCAGGVTDSITALKAIQSGASHDVKTAVMIADTAAANCSPANSMPMEDLVQYQVPESLASFHLERAVNDLVTWGFPLAQRVQADVATLVTVKTPAAIRRASVQLRRDRQGLDAERTQIGQLITAASRSLSAQVAPPNLPG